MTRKRRRMGRNRCEEASNPELLRTAVSVSTLAVQEGRLKVLSNSVYMPGRDQTISVRVSPIYPREIHRVRTAKR